MLESVPFSPHIYFKEVISADLIPSGFNTAYIKLDGELTSSLDWKRESLLAQSLVARGYKILWHLELGLFHRLKKPISYPMQFQSLQLAIQHFKDSLWKKFQDETLGVVLLLEEADFSLKFQWDALQLDNYKKWLNGREETQFLKSLYCAKASSDYLRLLIQYMPDDLTFFVILDASKITSPLLKLNLLNPETYTRFQMIVKGGDTIFVPYTWEEGHAALGYLGTSSQSLKKVRPRFGISIPVSNLAERALYYLEKNNSPYKLLPENTLIQEWDGLDYIFFDPSTLSLQGKRNLQGFCAAGGTVISLGDKVGLPQEIGFHDFAESLFK